MFPGMGGGRGRGGVNPKQLDAMMKQMGIKMEDIDAVEVIIRTPDKEIYFDDASVQKMTARGEVTWQVMGTAKTRARTDAAPVAPSEPAKPAGPLFTEDDVELVASQANVPKDAARKALEATKGQPAEAILKLLGEN